MTDSTDRTGDYIEDVDPDGILGDDRLEPTPEQHEQLKDALHGGLAEIRRAERRYLVVGRGGDEGSGRRRRQVRDLLDERPGATAFRLEDFGFTGEELALWAPAFEILSATSTHVVGVLEDFDGGHVWELGYLYRQQTRVRNALWLLKRVYDDEETNRDRYDNGMAASHLAALEAAAGDRVVEWQVPGDIPDAVAEIP